MANVSKCFLEGLLRCVEHISLELEVHHGIEISWINGYIGFLIRASRRCNSKLHLARHEVLVHLVDQFKDLGNTVEHPSKDSLGATLTLLSQ